MRRLRWGYLAACVLLVAVTGGLWSAWRRQLGPLSLADELTAARREGIPVDLQDLRNAENPKIPNAAGPYLAAVGHAASVVSGTRWLSDFDRLVGTREKPRPIGTLTAAERTELNRLLAVHRPGIASLREAGNRPALALFRSWERGRALTLQDLPALRLLVRVLTSRAELQAAEGNSDMAWEDLMVAARGAALLRDGLSYTEALARSAAEAAILDTANRLLRRDPAAESAPARLRQLVGAFGPPPNPRRIFMSEPYIGRLDVAMVAKDGEDPWLMSLRLASVRAANEAIHIAYWRKLYARLPHDPLDFEGAWSAAQSTWNEFERAQGLRAIAFRPRVDGGTIDTVIKVEARRRVTLAAADVLDAWAATGRFPAKLPNPVADPFGGPLRYHPRRNGFTVYSLDADRIDNHGRLYDGGSQKGDIAWEVVATR